MAKQQDDREVHAYGKMLDRLRHALDDLENDVRPRLRLALEQARERTVELGELTREEANRIAEYLRRDIEQAADYTTRNDQDLRGWLRMDIQLIEDWIWDRFSSVADQTRLDWMRFEQSLEEASTYHTGEVTGPGTLTCQNCEEQMQFHRPGRIPPCPHCHSTRFDREPR
jgi:hypothetical protein